VHIGECRRHNATGQQCNNEPFLSFRRENLSFRHGEPIADGGQERLGLIELQGPEQPAASRQHLRATLLVEPHQA
jgi:hypothetical protein